jgi:hypothetical protein
MLDEEAERKKAIANNPLFGPRPSRADRRKDAKHNNKKGR